MLKTMYINLLQIFLFLAHIFIIKVAVVPAQIIQEIISPEEKYQLLLTQFNILIAYINPGSEEKKLISESNQYANAGDFDIAIVYAEEAIDLLKQNKLNTTLNINELPSIAFDENSNDTIFTFSLLSGIDFNRQEFEVGFVQNDSTVIEEFGKPFAGVTAQLLIPLPGESELNIKNSMRYDKENFRDDYYIQWLADKNLFLQYGGYLNYSNEANSFWEHDFAAKVLPDYTKKINWMIYENFVFKKYKETNSSLYNYYKNRVEGNIEYNAGKNYIFNIKYINEINENLGFEDSDYLQHTFGTGYRKNYPGELNHGFYLQGVNRKYALAFEDSIINNQFNMIIFDSVFDIPFYSKLRLEIENNFNLKSYRIKSSFEPDYIWNYFRPTFYFNFSTQLELGLGYELELKDNKNTSNDELEVAEQNYRSNGIYASLNFFSSAGIYFSISSSYQWRRYPQSITNDLISLYSDRNILSLFFLAFVPISNRLEINAFITYDNDKDIDKEQQNNQSTIFNFGVEYKF